MTKEELLKFLRENLKICISASDGSCYSSPHIEIGLYLGDECISTDSHSLPEARPNQY